MSVSAEPSNGRREAAMPFILVTVLLDMVAIGLIVPALPFLVAEFADSPARQAYALGLVSFAFGLSNFFGAPILGALSDRWGRRPVLLIGFCGLALSFFGTAMANALWVLVVVRLFSGAMQANMAVAQAYVADITPPQDRARRFGLLGAAFGMGFILGPVMGGLLGAISLPLPFYVAGGLSLLNWLYGFFVLPESLPPERRKPFEWKRANPVAAFQGLTQLQGVRPLVAIVALSGMAQFILHTTWVLYTHFKFGWGPKESGWSLFAVGVASVVTQGWLLKHLLQRFAHERLALMGLVSSSLAFLSWALAPQGWMMYAVIALNLLGFAVANVVQSMISKAADAHSQGQTMGAVASLNSLMAVLAPVIGSALLGMGSTHTGDAGGRWLVGLPFYFCSALQLGSALVAWRFFKQRQAALAASA
jgi:DHA1 family tetracycline resistance protein-like MFS transporter